MGKSGLILLDKIRSFYLALVGWDGSSHLKSRFTKVVGGLLVDRQKMEGWGAGVLRRLATDLKNELSDQQGYSERNLKLMTQFYREYPGLFAIGQQAVAQLPDSTAGRKSRAGREALKGQQPVANIHASVHTLSLKVKGVVGSKTTYESRNR